MPQPPEGSRRKRPLQGCPQIAAKQAITDVIYFAPRNTIARVEVASLQPGSHIRPRRRQQACATRPPPRLRSDAKGV